MLDETRPNANSQDTMKDTFHKLVTLSFIMILYLQSFSQFPTHITDLVFLLGFPLLARKWARLTL